MVVVETKPIETFERSLQPLAKNLVWAAQNTSSSHLAEKIPIKINPKNLACTTANSDSAKEQIVPVRKKDNKLLE